MRAGRQEGFLLCLEISSAPRSIVSTQTERRIFRQILKIGTWSEAKVSKLGCVYKVLYLPETSSAEESRWGVSGGRPLLSTFRPTSSFFLLDVDMHDTS